jgi:hypothetical protein
MLSGPAVLLMLQFELRAVGRQQLTAKELRRRVYERRGVILPAKLASQALLRMERAKQAKRFDARAAAAGRSGFLAPYWQTLELELTSIDEVADLLAEMNKEIRDDVSSVMYQTSLGRPS